MDTIKVLEQSTEPIKRLRRLSNISSHRSLTQIEKSVLSNVYQDLGVGLEDTDVGTEGILEKAKNAWNKLKESITPSECPQPSDSQIEEATPYLHELGYIVNIMNEPKPITLQDFIRSIQHAYTSWKNYQEVYPIDTLFDPENIIAKQSINPQGHDDKEKLDILGGRSLKDIVDSKDLKKCNIKADKTRYIIYGINNREVRVFVIYYKRNKNIHTAIIRFTSFNLKTRHKKVEWDASIFKVMSEEERKSLCDLESKIRDIQYLITPSLADEVSPTATENLLKYVYQFSEAGYNEKDLYLTSCWDHGNDFSQDFLEDWNVVPDKNEPLAHFLADIVNTVFYDTHEDMDALVSQLPYLYGTFIYKLFKR